MGKILIIKGASFKPSDTGSSANSSLPSTGINAVDTIYYRGPDDYYYRDKQAALDAGGVYAVLFSFYIDQYTSKQVTVSPIEGFTTILYSYNKRNTDQVYELHELGFVKSDGSSETAPVTLTLNRTLPCGWAGYGKNGIFGNSPNFPDCKLTNIEILTIIHKFKSLYTVEAQ